MQCNPDLVFPHQCNPILSEYFLLGPAKAQYNALFSPNIEVVNFLEPTPHFSVAVFETTTDIQNYGVFGLCPSSGILETRTPNISETGSVSILKLGGRKTLTQLGPLERANLNH
jgi:hypothetical protein